MASVREKKHTTKTTPARASVPMYMDRHKEMQFYGSLYIFHDHHLRIQFLTDTMHTHTRSFIRSLARQQPSFCVKFALDDFKCEFCQKVKSKMKKANSLK